MFKALIVALAAVAVAIPTHPQHGGNTEVGNVCGNGNTIHCCNHETAGSLTQGGLLAADLDGLLSGCNDITATIIGAAVPIKNTCQQQTVCCNNKNTNGLVDLSCNNINL